jgi:hypothetical protein
MPAQAVQGRILATFNSSRPNSRDILSAAIGLDFHNRHALAVSPARVMQALMQAIRPVS